MENFEENYKKDILIQERKKLIEKTATKLKERYNKYEELAVFIDYLRAMEEFFFSADVYEWNRGKMTDELLKSDIYLLSLKSKIDADIFEEVQKEFKLTFQDLSKITEVAEFLLDKYGEDDDCKSFIEYLRDIFIIFARENDGERKIIKENLLRMKIEMLSSDGKPEKEFLEKIYYEFKANL